MKYLLSLLLILLILNTGPKEQPRPAETHIHPNYEVEEMQHIDDESDNNESIDITIIIK